MVAGLLIVLQIVTMFEEMAPVPEYVLLDFGR